MGSQTYITQWKACETGRETIHLSSCIMFWGGGGGGGNRKLAGKFKFKNKNKKKKNHKMKPANLF
jgi:hypothetical protein